MMPAGGRNDLVNSYLYYILLNPNRKLSNQASFKYLDLSQEI